jgi:hypothetical protein
MMTPYLATQHPSYPNIAKINDVEDFYTKNFFASRCRPGRRLGFVLVIRFLSMGIKINCY